MNGKVTLVFPTLLELWAFVKAIEGNSVDIRTADNSLTCQCSEDQIKLAIEKFHGRMLRMADQTSTT
jgi:hypothetical protein